jgi:hypothetical protein
MPVPIRPRFLWRRQVTAQPGQVLSASAKAPASTSSNPPPLVFLFPTVESISDRLRRAFPDRAYATSTGLRAACADTRYNPKRPTRGTREAKPRAPESRVTRPDIETAYVVSPPIFQNPATRLLNKTTFDKTCAGSPRQAMTKRGCAGERLPHAGAGPAERPTRSSAAPFALAFLPLAS